MYNVFIVINKTMKTVTFPPNLKDPPIRRLCCECPIFTEIRCIICKDYTCKKCIETDNKCSECSECVIKEVAGINNT